MKRNKVVFLAGFIFSFVLFLLGNFYTGFAAEEEPSIGMAADEETAGDEIDTAKESQTGQETRFLGGALRLETGADVAYDSNVFEYSKDDIEELEAYSNTDRFKGTRSISDIVTNMYGIVRFEKDIFDIGSTVFSLKVEGNIYTKNDDKSYEKYEASIKQRFGENNLIKAGYRFLPEYFIRTLYDPDLPAGTDRYKKADFRSDTVYAKYWHRLNDDLSFWLRYSFENKEYNDFFKERDTQSHRVTLAAGYKATAWLKLTPYFRYFWHDAEGNDADFAVDVDISRDGYDTGLNILFYPQGKFSYTLGYGFRWAEYNNSNSVADDPFHSGRDQHRQRLTGRVAYELKNNTTLFTKYEYVIRDVDVEGSDATLDEESILGYTKHVVKVGVKVKF